MGLNTDVGVERKTTTMNIYEYLLTLCEYPVYALIKRHFVAMCVTA